MKKELAKVLSVSELTQAIKEVLEPNFCSLFVKGEISNCKLQSSGHLYFSLKDAGSQIQAALFRGHAAKLARMPKDGDQVIATGEVSLYAPRGQYQILIRDLQFLGVGELLIQLHQLKEKLQARGWFHPEHKKALPKFPKRIGVVTSPTGAVIQDIIHVLTRRFSGFQIVLNPVKVQGEGAAEEIAKAIEDFNKYNLADLIIVGRGGGSMEDLWAFNEERVAQAIYESKLPIISAVGHETDFTIADWVADVRAPTPSAAAEMATAEKANLLQFLQGARKQCLLRLSHQMESYRRHLVTLKKHPALSSPYGVLAPLIQRLDEFSRRLEILNPKVKIQEHKDRLRRLQEHLRSLNPRNLLKKGYAILFDEMNHSIILSSKHFLLKQNFKVLMHDGVVEAAAKQVQEHGTFL
ncbi:MAG: exodeoxyribonuclease VII large subunit [Chlamydiae bacterium RIFCSPHIGHO2_12_FULL_44_59]|nr:MAG: exodeoxyribonuclease VII large subunit [Chlamydiae bacterium RIFCSPHIGHO2_02_FULL_45_9]OGN56845.1 MAG: exodeoxyribonuclease VII large subunit [Chlamydiae bacterium RIFCSPHIGHO2_01_FULL_44_39]OGN59562.1 MAG: exodeoxyribonuclease VII large subunit [Chlamydiae bacterium RIFCSPHIGHO2_12_FULL_44_59]OGN67308.1 MAG: exodeoxyribonuclease VII large subunit [Chlamydiae bacterium RIFCSPLOWO2_01_FULL_44_52]OGN68734.1 MAG: exodeoxyribonuclease VII large subunit [Chlamydiae bacterium RIFCSPLOWO2_02_F